MWIIIAIFREMSKNKSSKYRESYQERYQEMQMIINEKTLIIVIGLLQKEFVNIEQTGKLPVIIMIIINLHDCKGF